jgi:hypothetical protein
MLHLLLIGLIFGWPGVLFALLLGGGCGHHHHHNHWN